MFTSAKPTSIVSTPWPGVNNIKSLFQSGKQPRDFFGRMLEIVIHGHDNFIFRRANPAKERVMLAVVAH